MNDLRIIELQNINLINNNNQSSNQSRTNQTIIAIQNDDSNMFSQLKPFLRILLQWTACIFLINILITMAYNLVFGGTMLYRLATIRELRMVDNSKRYAHLMIIVLLLTGLCIKLIGFWLYQRDSVMIILFAPPEGRTVLYGLIKFARETLSYFVYFITLSMNSLWFIYSMVMFQRVIYHLQMMMECEGNSHLLIVINYFFNYFSFCFLH